MPGLEVLYTYAASSISCPQDALVCFVHWEIIGSGFKCVGSGDEPRSGDKKSELLPTDWSSSKELYTLRYQSHDDKTRLLVKAITVDNTLIFNAMDPGSDQVSDLTVTISDHVDADHLQMYNSVFKDAAGLSEKVRSQLLPPAPAPRAQPANRKAERKSRRDTPEEEEQLDVDPLRVPRSQPDSARQPHWADPMAPFAAGRADLDPFGGGGGGMIVDPLRAGFPRSGFDPSGGLPGVLPPGAVPPGARFDPFGPVGRTRPGPDPDHMPPPGYDDMFM